MDTLRLYLDAHYIKVSELAKAAGIPRTTLYKYTSGGGSVWNMSIDTFARMAHALGMTADGLIAELRELEARHGDGAAGR